MRVKVLLPGGIHPSFAKAFQGRQHSLTSIKTFQLIMSIPFIDRATNSCEENCHPYLPQHINKKKQGKTTVKCLPLYNV